MKRSKVVLPLGALFGAFLLLVTALGGLGSTSQVTNFNFFAKAQAFQETNREDLKPAVRRIFDPQPELPQAAQDVAAPKVLVAIQLKDYFSQLPIGQTADVVFHVNGSSPINKKANSDGQVTVAMAPGTKFTISVLASGYQVGSTGVLDAFGETAFAVYLKSNAQPLTPDQASNVIPDGLPLLTTKAFRQEDIKISYRVAQPTESLTTQAPALMADAVRDPKVIKALCYAGKEVVEVKTYVATKDDGGILRLRDLPGVEVVANKTTIRTSVLTDPNVEPNANCVGNSRVYEERLRVVDADTVVLKVTVVYKDGTTSTEIFDTGCANRFIVPESGKGGDSTPTPTSTTATSTTTTTTATATATPSATQTRTATPTSTPTSL